MAAEAQREREEAKLAELAAEYEALQNLDIYHDHAYNLIHSLIAGDLSLEDLDSDGASWAVCGTAELLLAEGTGERCCVFLLLEPIGSAVKEFVQDALQKLPGTMGRSFEVLVAPGLKSLEIEAFEVSVDSSWLDYKKRIDGERGEVEVFEEDHLEKVQRGSPDLEAFKECGYRSVRAISFQRGRQTGYLVVVSHAASPFSNLEGRYLMWLRHAIELDEAIRNGPHSRSVI